MMIRNSAAWNLGEREELSLYLQCKMPGKGESLCSFCSAVFLKGRGDSRESGRGNLWSRDSETRDDIEANPGRILEQIEMLYFKILSPRKSSSYSVESQPQVPLTESAYPSAHAKEGTKGSCSLVK